MLTESCVMCFSPSRAVLSAILRDEYLTSAVRTPSLLLLAIYQNSENKPRGCRGLYFSKALFEGLIFGGAYLRREIWVQHRLGYPYKWKEILPFLPCITLCLRAISKYKPPRGAYIWRGDLTEGFLRYEFGGLIFGGPYTNLRNFTVMETRPYVSFHFSVVAVELNVNAEE